MQITVKSKNMALTEALKEYAKKKLSRIQKYFDNILYADVMLCTERNFHVVEVTVHANGFTLRGEERTEDMYSSIDKVIDKLERQTQKHKEKLQERHRLREGESESMAVMTIPRTRITTKKQRLLAFTPDEAAAEMERLGYNFYVFQNPETEELNVIYRRENGTLSVLEPIL